ncbi:outer membrane protein assembly factor BamB family protein [Rugosimonospora acidiphila]
MRAIRTGAVVAALAVSAALTLAACSGDRSPAAGPSAGGPSAGGSSPASTGASGSPAGAAAQWPMYHGTPDRAGVSAAMPPAAGAPRRVRSLRLDGAVYASPIVVGGLTIVATENDTVYAFDQFYAQVWRRSLGKPSPSEERQCGDIDPLGITGTPVYDASTDKVYLVAEHGGAVRHELYALDPRTGSVAWSKSVDLPGVSARDMQQRGALAVAGGKVWVSYGAQAGDCGDYKGRVVGVPLDGGDGVVFYSPPTERGGGIWNPNGPTVTADGHLLVVSANGAGFPGDAYDHTNTVLELDASARLVDSFAPEDWARNNQGDVGLGSQGVALIGDTWAVLGGKSGPVYVLRQGHLGGIDGQVDVRNVCRSFGGAAVSGSVVYLPCTDGVRAVRVDDAGKLHVLWHADQAITGSPVIGGGRVWVLDTRGGVLHGLDPNSGKSLGQVDVGEANRFSTPAIAGADVIVGTLTGIAVVRTS